MHVHENEAGADLLWQGCFSLLFMMLKLLSGKAASGADEGVKLLTLRV